MLPAQNQSSVQAQTQEGLEMAFRGAVVLAIDAPYVRRAGPILQFLPADSAEQVQLIQELQRAVDVLVARGDVDPNRLAFIGLGYGGTMGALLAGVETRLKAYALAVPDAGWVARYTSASDTLAPLDTMPPAQRGRWFAAMGPIEPLAFVSRAAPAALLIQSAQNDELVAHEDAVALHDAASSPRTILWYAGLHALPAQAKTDRQAFLATKVGTSP
jgi:dienelactone hydrolase